MSLEIIFGKNKSGKTKYLEEKYKNQDSKVLFLESEIDFDNVLKGNLGTPAKEILPPHRKFLNFFNEIIGRNYQIELHGDKYNELIEWKKIFDNFFEPIKNNNDEFFERCFKDSLNTENLSENNFTLQFDLLKFNPSKRQNLSGSSGSLSYSSIKMLYEMISNEDVLGKKFSMNGFKLIIDEVEKFLHPELIFKVAHMLVKISERMDVIVTTHSPIFLERIFYINKNILKVKTDFNIKYSLKYSNVKKEDNNNCIFTLDNKKIEEILKTNNYRILSNLSSLLFSSRCFFVEGLLDTSIITNIIQDVPDLEDKHYTIIDCGGKSQLKQLYNLAKKLDILKFYKVCLFYDKDNSKTFDIINDCSQIVNDPDLEKTFFNLDEQQIGNNKNKTKCLEIKSGWVNLENFKKEEINLINSNDNYFFCFTPDWIKENSTKSNKEIEEKINNLKGQIIKFMIDN